MKKTILLNNNLRMTHQNPMNQLQILQENKGEPEQNINLPEQETSNQTNEPVTNNTEKEVDSKMESNEKPNKTDNENNKDEVK